MSAAAADAREAFVERFDIGWRGGREGFLDHFLPALVDEQVVLAQPLLPAVRGHDGFRGLFEPLFAAIPDLRGEVLDWRREHDGVTIELALRGTLDGVPLAFVTRDRIVLREGRMLERRAQFDPLPLLLATVRRPRAGLPLLVAPLRRRLAAEERGLLALAAGRLFIGAVSRAAPRAAMHLLGTRRAASPELDYMTRVFGIRAIALGTGWLTSSGSARRRWQRLALACDVSDTLAGIGHLRRRDVPRPAALALTALTGGYALVGGAKVVRDLRGAPGE